jgi:hypothetical protein
MSRERVAAVREPTAGMDWRARELRRRPCQLFAMAHDLPKDVVLQAERWLRFTKGVY